MRLPGATNRTVIIGQNGSGKSTFGCWLLSQMNWHVQPWIILDYKYDELLAEIPGVVELGINEKLPSRPGLYIARPYGDRRDQKNMLRKGSIEQEQIDSDVEHFMMRVWVKERTGLFLDEGYLVPDRQAFKMLLVTGRSKRIPMIVNTQRPTWVPRHVFSESNFFVVFRLNDNRDQKIVEHFIPIKMSRPLPEFHSYFYDSGRHDVVVLKPVPMAEEILELYDARMMPARRMSWR